MVPVGRIIPCGGQLSLKPNLHFLPKDGDFQAAKDTPTFFVGNPVIVHNIRMGWLVVDPWINPYII